jgi:hypothetical protein
VRRLASVISVAAAPVIDPAMATLYIRGAARKARLAGRFMI